MIEDIKHWKGTSQFKRGYDRAMHKNQTFTSKFYLDPQHYPPDFIAGFKRGEKRHKLEQLIKGKHE